MPNRIIKESICTSEEVAALTWFEEVVFYRLIVTCDDYGRFDGRIKILKSRMFPLNPDVTETSLAKAINKLSTCGLVMQYINDGKPYLQLKTWEKHQRVRNKASKYPAPPKEPVSQNNTFADNCCQLTTFADNCVRNPIQSESNPISRGGSAREYIKGLFARYFETEPTDHEIGNIIEIMTDTVGKHEFCEDDRYLLDIAFGAANKAGKRNVAYIEGVFNNFKKRNIKTKEDHIRYEERRSQAVKAKSGSKAKKSKTSEGYAPSYDIEEFNRRSEEEPLIYHGNGDDET